MEKGLHVSMDVIRRHGTHCFSLIKAFTNAVTSFAVWLGIITSFRWNCQDKDPLRIYLKLYLWDIKSAIKGPIKTDKTKDLILLCWHSKKRANERERDIGGQGISQSVVSLIPGNPFLRVKIRELMLAGCSQRKQMIRLLINYVGKQR